MFNNQNSRSPLAQKLKNGWFFLLNIFSINSKNNLNNNSNGSGRRFVFLPAFSELAWPSRHQWKQFFKISTKNERVMLFSFTIIILISSFFPFRSLYVNSTDIVPAKGGVYIEAYVGAPRYINPVLAPANDVDRDIASIVYSSLFKYDGSGNLIPDLVDTHSLSEDKKEYKIRLKQNINWHDKKNLTADDVIFTMQLIQNPDFKSPLRN